MPHAESWRPIEPSEEDSMPFTPIPREVMNPYVATCVIKDIDSTNSCVSYTILDYLGTPIIKSENVPIQSNSAKKILKRYKKYVRKKTPSLEVIALEGSYKTSEWSACVEYGCEEEREQWF